MCIIIINENHDIAIHTPPEWATCQKSWPEKWYTTYCQGPLGLPKNAFGLIWELNFQEKITFYWFVGKCQTKPCSWQDIWTLGEILTYLKKKFVQIRPLFAELKLSKSGSHFQIFVICNNQNMSDLEIFFFKQVRILPGVQISHQLQDLVCHLVTNQRKVIISQKISCSVRFDQRHFWTLLGVPNNM